VGRIGSGVRVSATFQIFRCKNIAALRGGGLPPRDFSIGVISVSGGQFPIPSLRVSIPYRESEKAPMGRNMRGCLTSHMPIIAGAR